MDKHDIIAKRRKAIEGGAKRVAQIGELQSQIGEFHIRQAIYELYFGQ